MPLIRDPGQRASLYPKVEPLLAGLPKELAPRRRRQGSQRPLRPHRIARQEADADARRSRGLQRRPQRRPRGQGVAEEHRLRRRRRAGHRRQHQRQLRRRRPDPHRGEHAESLVGGRPGRRVPDRRRSSSTTAPTTASASASTASRSRCSTANRKVVFEKTKHPGARREGASTRSAASRRRRLVRRAAMNALTVRARQGDRDVQGAGAASSRTTPTAQAAVQRPAAHSRDLLAQGRGQTAAGRHPRLHPQGPGDGADFAGGAGRDATGRRAGVAAAAGRGQGGPQGAGRAGRARDPPVAR